jgi:hypothetical protein
MYTYNELNAVELSPTKKDYYQVWNELLDVTAKLSERWSPVATNEADPGIVLLKVLTAVADKLSYNIDSNMLEAFMPSAAQESSMRKLCDMLGYTMQFYKSATTQVRITYNGEVFPAGSNIIKIDKFSNIKNIDNTINYILLNDVLLGPSSTSAIEDCIEGELITCETNLGARVTFEHLDDNYRFYLPEHQVASNKIFISKLDEAGASEWERVDNLNTRSLGSYVFKFGYDSSRGLPFVQFPEDIGALIGTGLKIQFIRTSGLKGNVAINTLKSLEAPASWTAAAIPESDTVTAGDLVEDTVAEDTSWTDITLYSVSNITAATNGKDPESIDEAYWNFQKTIGTFDTLVTCRDYMNKIYQLTQSDIDDTPLVSNIIVSDIRDDINRSYPISTLTADGVATKYKVHKDDNGQDRIHYFDLVLYPFIYKGQSTQSDYEESFTYSDASFTKIEGALQDYKTMAHKYLHGEALAEDDIACIKVYFQLSARLATTEKLSVLGASEIEAAAHAALYKEFNMRKMVFGEELPFDSILKTLLNSHSKIKSVNLDDPKTYLTICTVKGDEYQITGEPIFKSLSDARKARDFYLSLTLKNALAGKLPLFNYDNTFKSAFDLEAYPAGPAKTNTSASKLLPSDTLLKLDDANCFSSPIQYFVPADNKIATYITTKQGTCHISLNRGDSWTDLLNKIKTITLSIYRAGDAKATHTIIYKSYIDNTSDINSGLVLIGTTPMISDIICTPRFLTDANATSTLNLAAITLNSATNNFDKIQITVEAVNASSLENTCLKLQLKEETAPLTSVIADEATRNVFDLTKTLAGNTAVSNISTEDKLVGLPTSMQYLAIPNNTDIDDIKATKITLSVPEDFKGTIRLYPAGTVPSISPELLRDKKIIYNSDTQELHLMGGDAYTESCLYLGKFTLENSKSFYRAASAGASYETGWDLNTEQIEHYLKEQFSIKLSTVGYVINFNKHNNDRLFNCPLPVENFSELYYIESDSADINKISTYTRFELQEAQTGGALDYILSSLTSEDYTVQGFSGNVDITLSADGYTQAIFIPETILELDTTNLLPSIPTPPPCPEGFEQPGPGAGEVEIPEVEEDETVEDVKYYLVQNVLQQATEVICYDTFFADDAETCIVEDTSGEAGLTLKTIARDNQLPTTKISSDFLVHHKLISEEEPLELSSKEVIQFRAPNFKTVATYPAYVNYYLKLNPNITGRGKTQPALPATMQTLTEFFNGGYTGYPEKACWNRQISWNEKLTSLLNSDPVYRAELAEMSKNTETASINTYNARTTSSSTPPSPAPTPDSRFVTKCFTTDDSNAISGATPAEIAARMQYSKAIKKYGTLLTKGLRCSYNTNNADKNADKVVKCDVEAVSGYHPFILPTDSNYKYDIPEGITFYGVKIDATTFAAVAKWLKGDDTAGSGGSGTGGDNNNAGGTSGTDAALPYHRIDVAAVKPSSLESFPPDLVTDPDLLKNQGLYSRSPSNSAKKPGLLVDENCCSYKLMTSVPEDISFDSVYVPRLWPSLEVTAGNHTPDGLGRDAIVDGLQANADYALAEGEYLLFTYSTSAGQEDGTTVVKNIAYGKGTIIRANFRLIDSNNYREVADFTKTSDYGPWSLGSGNILTSTSSGGTIPGMFSLGASETIEIRERIKVTLDGATTFLYWEVKEPIQDASGIEYFLRTEGNTGEEFSYTLQPGEYLYYTDSAKEAIAYYGSGTEIVLGKRAPSIWRNVTHSVISAEQINKLGLVGAIPWVEADLSRADGGIIINEYQYVNLVEGDTLKAIVVSNPEAKPVLDHSFTAVDSATYVSSGVEASLPVFLIPDCGWSASCRLDLALSPTIGQTLNVHQTSTGKELARDILKLLNINDEVIQVYTPLLDTTKETFETNISDDNIVEKDEVAILTVKFKKVNEESSADTIYYRPELAEGQYWQEVYGNRLVVAKNYYTSKDTITQNSDCQECTTILHFYTAPNNGTSEYKNCLFSTPAEGSILVDSDTGTHLTVDLSGEYPYPRLRLDVTPETIVPEGEEVTIKFYAQIVTGKAKLAPGKSAVPLTVFADSPLISNSGDLSLMDDPSKQTFKSVTIKACKKRDLTLPNDRVLTVNEKTPTQLPLDSSSRRSTTPFVTLSTLIPQDSLGLFTIYVDYVEKEAPTKVYITTNAIDTNELSPADHSISIFNNGTLDNVSDWTWWSDMENSGSYSLRNGLNPIVVSNSCLINIFVPLASQAKVLIDTLQIIPKEDLFNPQLAYTEDGAIFALDVLQATSEGAEDADNSVLRSEYDQAISTLRTLLSSADSSDTAIADAINTVKVKQDQLSNISHSGENSATISDPITSKRFAGVDYDCLYISQNLVLAKLAELDPDLEFYYSGSFTDNSGIELNDADPADTLMLAKNWFDKQNIANKFIISEIATKQDKLADNVIISKTSRM